VVPISKNDFDFAYGFVPIEGTAIPLLAGEIMEQYLHLDAHQVTFYLKDFNGQLQAVEEYQDLEMKICTSDRFGGDSALLAQYELMNAYSCIS